MKITEKNPRGAGRPQSGRGKQVSVYLDRDDYQDFRSVCRYFSIAAKDNKKLTRRYVLDGIAADKANGNYQPLAGKSPKKKP